MVRPHRQRPAPHLLAAAVVAVLLQPERIEAEDELEAGNRLVPQREYPRHAIALADDVAEKDVGQVHQRQSQEIMRVVDQPLLPALHCTMQVTLDPGAHGANVAALAAVLTAPPPPARINTPHHVPLS